MEPKIESGAALRLETRGSKALRVWRTIVVALGVSIPAVWIGVELLYARWAPWVANTGVSALVTVVWAYNLLPILRRQRSVLGGLSRALAFAAAGAVAIAGALYLAR